MPETYTRLVYHLVFSTKDRVPFITADLRERLFPYLGGIVRGEGGTPVEIGGVADHVHVLLGLRPTRAVSDLVRVLKASSSKWVNEQPGHGGFAWQAGYGAFSVSGSRVDAVRRYVRGQIEHHRRRSFDEEVAMLCAAHGIEVPGGPWRARFARVELRRARQDDR